VGAQQTIADAHRSLIYEVAWSPDDAELVTSSADNTVGSTQQLRSLEMHRAIPASLVVFAFVYTGSGLGRSQLEEPCPHRVHPPMRRVHREVPAARD